MREIKYRGEWFKRPLYTGPWYISYNERKFFKDWQPMIFFQSILHNWGNQQIRHCIFMFGIWRMTFSFEFDFAHKPEPRKRLW